MIDPESMVTPKDNIAERIGMLSVERQYAEAVYGAAQSAQVVESLLEELESVVKNVLDANPKFEAVFHSLRVSVEEKEEMIDRVFGSQTSKLLIHTLKIIARHQRLSLLRGIVQQYRQLYEEDQGLRRVEVRTAAELTSAQEQQLTEHLKQKFKIKPVLIKKVDPNLLGGLVIRMGDSVYDGSVATQLHALRQELIHRSTHEIQSRRDRFSSSEGN